MSQDNQTDKRPRIRFRFLPMLHVAMGIFFLVLAVVVGTMRKFGTIDLGQGYAYGFSALLFLYGIFRIWRGVQDLKISSEEEA